MATASRTTPRDLSPTAQRWRRFLAHRRGAWSLRLLAGLYAVSLASELLCNDRPLWLRHRGRSFFPVVRAYTQDQVLGNGIRTRMTDYRSLWSDPAFRSDRSSRVLLPLIPYGPHENLRSADLAVYRRVTVTARPISRVARVQVDAAGRVLWSEGDIPHFFPGIGGPAELAGRSLEEAWPLPPELREAFERRLAGGQACPAAEALCRHAAAVALRASVRMAPREEGRGTPADSVRIVLRVPEETPGRRRTLRPRQRTGAFSDWEPFSPGIAPRLEEAVAATLGEFVPPLRVPWADTAAEVDVTAEEIAWPFRPVPGHWLGIDMAGRDVLARLLYGLRTSLTFGLLLVAASLFFGIVAGAIQGYFAGWVDLAGQRLTEIWSALPFLYVMILLGNSLGRSFGLLLCCYAAFNWIGVSAYVRAEYLRLRVRAFVDSARSQGLGAGRIMLRHILPNALTPLITLFPFELVGAVGSLAALDYLGFGLPDGTPSWGDLLRQAQLVRHAWWLILYPSLALFVVMLLGIFVGEGLRDAFDPKPYSKLE